MFAAQCTTAVLHVHQTILDRFPIPNYTAGVYIFSKKNSLTTLENHLKLFMFLHEFYSLNWGR